MKKHFLAELLALGLLAGCTSHQPSPEERGVFFPLPPCTPEVLEKAGKISAGIDATNNDLPAKFDKNWVCATKPEALGKNESEEVNETDQQTIVRLEAQAFSDEEQRLRDTLESPFTHPNGKRPALGIALSGGGSKASSFAIGVLAGLADQQLLDSSDYVSSVSGGSYAAYFYYTHRIYPIVRNEKSDREIPTSEDLFRDCILSIGSKYTDPKVVNEINRYGACKPYELLYSSGEKSGGVDKNNKYQAFLRCQQDVFKPGICSTQRTSEDFGIPPIAFVGTAVAVPLSLIANTVFDTGITVSPTARSYRDGIGIAYGATISDINALKPAQGGHSVEIPCTKNENGYATDCKPNRFDPDPVDMTFEELRTGLLAIKKESKIPFWIINAAAPKSRSGLGWWAFGEDDTTNSDMFELTAVSHGSGRYGYVSAPASLHNMTVLDAVASSAAFLDANQLVYKEPLTRGGIGVLAHTFAADWGIDIPNYNVQDSRRTLHKWLPVPLYWLDGGYARYLTNASTNKETQDRVRSSFIRLIDGGNGENLGVYSLFKRNVRNIVLADAASDPDGKFGDICSLAARLKNVPKGRGGYLYMPGLNNFNEHCAALLEHKQGYNIREWPFEFPTLVGCIRKTEQANEADACGNLSDQDTRLIVVKPAINMTAIMARELKGYQLRTCGVPGSPSNVTGSKIPLLNCDAAALILNSWNRKKSLCQVFPQNSTVFMTANSSLTLFSAYRELARQYVNQAGELIRLLKNEDPQGAKMFSDMAKSQATQYDFRATQESCEDQLKAAKI
ncbi:hypothetical protein [Pseudomonas sp. S1Bt23]|uniref:hypothetical protein n=1 Tax=Pseudomonas sp. S1Bt23 TaxID=3095074 RepID=UPI002A5AA984|nr:hypothetical protein [Pseudomonas sp. S1Bt23]WPO48679.1 hypothetical protein SHB59_06275 [Pseudomonas sp. S1Bt23]